MVQIGCWLPFGVSRNSKSHFNLEWSRRSTPPFKIKGKKGQGEAARVKVPREEEPLARRLGCALSWKLFPGRIFPRGKVASRKHPLPTLATPVSKLLEIP